MDASDAAKIWDRHQVTPAECEELFFNRPLVVGSDERHSAGEERPYALGQSDSGRLMLVVFTIRRRPIPSDLGARYERQGANDLSIIMKKALPKFKNEDAEREFWARHDATEFIDWREGKRAILPGLKPSQTISLRLPKPTLDRLQFLANKRDVPYQSLLKMFVAERLNGEFKKTE